MRHRPESIGNGIDATPRAAPGRFFPIFRIPIPGDPL